MVSENKYESLMIDKKFKEKHTGTGGANHGKGTISHYRSPRHQWRSEGDRMKTHSNGCFCCTRCPKTKFVVRLQNKKDLRQLCRDQK